TLVWLISMPSLSNSPWIRGAPHSGLAMPISRISRRISTGTFGRPERGRDFQLPIRSEPGTMPTDDSLRLHNRQRIEGTWHQTIEANKNQAIHDTQGQSLRQMPSLDVKLMTKDQDLSFQRGSRPEQ